MSGSARFFLAGVAMAAIAVASTMYVGKLKRDFSVPTTITMGTVVRKGALLGKSRSPGGASFCWVSYEFTAPDGVRRTNSRFWEPACGVAPGRPIPIQHVTANPDVNRPAGSDPWFPSWLFFFGAGVMLVVAFIMRGHSPSTEEAGSCGTT